jgi:HK97 family phage portal protein
MKLKDYKLIAPNANKAVSLEQFNNDALWRETSHEHALRPRNKQSDMIRSNNYRDDIGVLYRCVDIRSSSISSLPFTLLKGDDVFIDSETAWEKPGFEWVSDITNLLYLTEASLLLSSEAYWLKNYSLTKKLLGLRWLAAPYINPVYDEKSGITAFRRNLGHGDDQFSPEQIVYFWIQNPMGELTPDIPQVLAAANSADVILNYENFVRKFYERGAVKATILKVDRSTSPAERNRLREFWQSFMSGSKNAYNTEVVSGDVESEVIGEGAGDSEKTEILTSRRKDIATAMGVPYSLLFGDTSSSYTAGPTEEKNYLNYSVIPRARLIQSFLNKQLFAEHGLQFRFNFGALPAFKEAGEIISKIFTTYTEALMPHSVAARIAGVTLPEGITYDDLDKFAQEERERQFKEKERIVTLNSKLLPDSGGKEGGEKKPAPPKAHVQGEDNNLKSEGAKVEETRRFTKWLKNRGGEIDIDDFASDILDEEEKLFVYKMFVDKRGGGTAQAPFLLSSKPSIKSMAVYGDEEGEEPEGLMELDEEASQQIKGALAIQLGFILRRDNSLTDEELFSGFEQAFIGDSAELKSAIFSALLAYADFGVEVAAKKVSQFYPGMDFEESRYQARDWAQVRALEVFNLVMAASMRKVKATFDEYKRGGLSREWLYEEIQKIASPERALLIAENESVAVITQAAYIVYSNTKLVQYVKWVTMRDERVCPRCGPLHGKVYPLGGQPAIPVHVRCRCQILPMVDKRILKLLAGLL